MSQSQLPPEVNFKGSKVEFKKNSLELIIESQLKSRKVEGIEIRLIDHLQGKLPLIVCECGNYNQDKFKNYLRTVITVPDENYPHRRKTQRVMHVSCDCGNMISREEFNKMEFEIRKQLKK